MTLGNTKQTVYAQDMRVNQIVLLLIVGVSSGLLTGCEKPLFPKEEPRTPYQRYMMLRGTDRPEKVENAYGWEEPNLRERLQPLGAR